MHADEVLVEGLRCEVREHVRKLDKRLARASRGKIGGVHDGRTSCRRIRVDLDLMARTVFSRRRSTRLSERLRDVERALAKPRDLDVMRNDLGAYLRLNPGAAAGLRHVDRYLAKKRARASKKATGLLDKRTRSKLVGDLRELLESAPKRAFIADKRDAQPVLVRHFTHELIWHEYDAIRAFEPKLPGDEATLHRFRSACRQLRFAMEVFGGALRSSPGIVEDLVALQEQIGEMHDHHVAVTKLRRWRARGDLEGTPELERYLNQRADARDRLKQRFEARWLAHLGKGFRLRLAGAIESEVPAAA
jgi:CHAD domain-containing protein